MQHSDPVGRSNRGGDEVRTEGRTQSARRAQAPRPSDLVTARQHGRGDGPRRPRRRPLGGRDPRGPRGSQPAHLPPSPARRVPAPRPRHRRYLHTYLRRRYFNSARLPACLPSYGAALGVPGARMVGTLIKLVYTASRGGGADGTDLRFAKFERRRLQECFNFIRAEGLLASNGGTDVSAYAAHPLARLVFASRYTERVVCFRCLLVGRNG